METNERCWLYLNENASRRTQKKKTKSVRKKSNLPTTTPFLIFNILALISLLAFGIIVSNKQQEKLISIEKQVATLNESQRLIPNTSTNKTTMSSTPVISSSSSFEEEQSTESLVSSTTFQTEQSTEISETSHELEDTPVVVVSNTYTVQQGDTLSTIAEKNNLTVQTIKEKNNLTDDIVYIGQVLELF